MYSLYRTFTTEDTNKIGHIFTAICKRNDGYESKLTVGKEYQITITPRILPCSPLCKVMGDDTKVAECHLIRFEKVEKGE